MQNMADSRYGSCTCRKNNANASWPGTEPTQNKRHTITSGGPSINNVRSQDNKSHAKQELQFPRIKSLRSKNGNHIARTMRLFHYGEALLHLLAVHSNQGSIKYNICRPEGKQPTVPSRSLITDLWIYDDVIVTQNLH